MKKVSFVMPCYNTAPYVAEAVRSVITQSYKDIELIIVNDGSKDTTYSVLQFFLKRDERGIIKYIHQKNKGAASALNAGMALATGDIILVADSDDVQERDRAKVYAEAFEQKIDFAYSGYFYGSIHAKPQYEVHPKPMTVEGIKNNDSIPGASIAISRSVYEKGLRYREDLKVNYDLGLIIDLYKMNLKYALLDIPTFTYRVLDTGMSYAKKQLCEEVTKELIKEL
jgi:glycosyltransferase involved in cell wall biosynthesis